MAKGEILYQYTIKTNGLSTILKGYKEKMPIVTTYENAADRPIVAAALLRDLAKWAIGQAEIIEELETGKPMPERELDIEYRAEIVPVGKLRFG